MHSLLKSISDRLLATPSASPDDVKAAVQHLLDHGATETIHEFLDWGHLPEVNQALTKAHLGTVWVHLIAQAIEKSGYTVAHLLRQRVERYGDKPFFQTVKGNRITAYSYREIAEKIHHIQGCLLASQSPDHPLVVGLYTPNRLEAACVDLACLGAGIRVIPLPANSSPSQLEYILHHAAINLVFVGGTETVTTLRETRLTGDQSWIRFPGTPDLPVTSQSWEDFNSLKPYTGPNPHPTDPNLATILYTSGTTDTPKGIVFSQVAMLTKRFARAVALPGISSKDSFLAYLPLYHTFGRFFEMMGTLFWGATYTFAESPTFKTLLSEFSLVRPTVFISIPKRWVQLYEQVRNTDSFDQGRDKDIQRFLKKLTGGRLTWGLSAAGYLDPDIFEFFQHHNIHLLSGYGMTEATGGITMTPPDDYVRNSVGIALPGLDAKLGSDGELCIRGPYVCQFYYGDPLQPTHQDGWFHTGDIFEEKDGHYFIVDRKKDIYKNSRGQTISPQKIENLFQDFEPIRRVFLVGDGLEFNTVLIYPNPEYYFPEDMAGNESERREFFSSLIQSVNSFLAPFERIVNFALIDRDFSEKAGELTRKGTYKRKVILEHFSHVIEPMYARNYLPFIVGQYELQIPNWLTREWGITRSEITWDGDILKVRDRTLKAHLIPDKNMIQLGNFDYELSRKTIDLNALIAAPELWVGNHALVQFLDNALFRIRTFESCTSILLKKDHLPFTQGEPEFDTHTPSSWLGKLHHLACQCFSSKEDTVLTALSALQSLLNDKDQDRRRLIVPVLIRCRLHPAPTVREFALNAVLPYLDGNEFLSALLDTLSLPHSSDPSEITIDIAKMNADQFHAILSYLDSLRSSYHESPIENRQELIFLLRLLSRYGSIHPIGFRWIRSELVWWHLVSGDPEFQKVAKTELDGLTQQFRQWLGTPQQVAIDPETGEEITWKDVVLFDEHIDDQTQTHLLKLFSTTQAISEAVFLFTGKQMIRLEDIAPKGIWVSYLGTNYQKSVFRILIQTHSTEAYNLVININEGLSTSRFEEETSWLILMSTMHHGSRLVEMFGGYWPEFQLYTEEYIPGETVRQYLEVNRKEIASRTNPDRWRMRWLHFIWNGAMAYVEFWRRSGFTLGFQEPTTDNLIIPVYDYTTGTRLISITNRSTLTSLLELLVRIYQHFILKTERDFQGLQRMADWEILLTAATQRLSVKGAFIHFENIIRNWDQLPESSEAQTLGLTPDRLRRFMSDVESEGVLTKPVVFASLRYERWLQLNPDATREARGSLLKELYNDYHLANLLEDYPETRIRFFLMTCFKNSAPKIQSDLYELQKALRSRSISLEELDIQLTRIQQNSDLSEDDAYFLSRLLFEHLESTEQGELITWDWGAQNRLDLITAVEDLSGNQYQIRPPFQPKEIAHFHALLQVSNFNPVFRQEHQFLLIFNSNRVVVGGVYWKPTSINTAYIERIVISHRYRKQHLSTRLLEELFNRLRDRSYQYITVGFFQAGLFYKLGFTVNKKFGGLVKPL